MNRYELDREDEALLALLRGERLSDADIDWERLFRAAVRQGVAGLAYDRLNSLDARPPRPVVLQWAATVAAMEQRYRRYERALMHLRTFYKSQGIDMLVLKGYRLCRLWPVPEHRPTGDIDIYLGPRWREADQLVSDKLGIALDHSHHHHTVFHFEGEMVENHYDFFNVHAHRSTPRIERRMKELAAQGDRELLHLLFVCRHAGVHFASNALSLRQALDWAFLARHVSDEQVWQTFYSDAQWMGMLPFVLCLNAVCIDYLGFPPAIFHSGQKADPALVRRQIYDILHPVDAGLERRGVRFVAHRFRVWRTNLWKHRMVYTDTPLSTFAYQLVSHIMKPRSITGK